MAAGHRGDRYRIRVAGHLDPSWASWFGHLAIQHRDDGTTLLEGTVTDQAALYGLLERARDLGLTLLAVEHRPDRAQPTEP